MQIRDAVQSDFDRITAIYWITLPIRPKKERV